MDVQDPLKPLPLVPPGQTLEQALADPQRQDQIAMGQRFMQNAGPPDSLLTHLGVPGAVNDKIAQTNMARLGGLPAALAQSAISGFTLPHDAMTGQVDPFSDEGIARGRDFAGMLTLGGGGGVVIRGGVAKDTLGIVPVPAAKASGVPIRLPDNPDFAKAIAGTPGAAITPEGVEIGVTRRQLPEQADEESVRGGVFYLPSGSPNVKHYTTGKNGYGGPQKIEGATLFRSPLFIKGATGGKAPEAAFDQLLGKGSYAAMREDALKSVLGWSMSARQKIDATEAFLQKYAPELGGRADYIISRSGKGNQLPYALQEAAVASAVRKAGHDGVLGYSVTRGNKEPFVSEVFDVRENAYPSPDGGYSVWPQFEPQQIKGGT